MHKRINLSISFYALSSFFTKAFASSEGNFIEGFDLCLTGKTEGRMGNKFQVRKKLGKRTEQSDDVYVTSGEKHEASAMTHKGIAETHPAKGREHHIVVAPTCTVG